MKRKWIIELLVVIMLALVVGIIYINLTKSEQEQKDSKFKIITTFYPIYIMAQNITEGAQNIELENMADINVGCLHDYTLSTTDMKKIENANVIIQNGCGLEKFMDKILQTYSNIKIVDSSKNIVNRIEENGEVNAHIWTNLDNYMLQIEEIANELSTSNPENEAIYKANKQKYLEKLQELKEKYNNESVNIRGKKAICLNEALTYMAKETGLEVISIETDHEESSLSAERMKEIIKQMKEENITAILVDNEDNLKSAETLKNETNAEIYKLKSGLTGEIDKDAYINAMKENIEILKQIH